MNQPEQVVSLEKISFAYDQSLALDSVDLTVNRGDFMGVIGPNGSGKTTLLKVILGLLNPGSGQVKVFGKPPGRRPELVGYVPQYAKIDRLFPVSVLDIVLMGRLGAAPFFGGYRASDVEAAKNALDDVEMLSFSEHQLGKLSGGQRQRVLIARALANSPRLLLLDEPTSSVDPRVEKGFYSLLKKLNETATIILVSHDLGFVSTYVNRVACVNKQLAVHHISEISSGEVSGPYAEPMHSIAHVCEI